MKKSLLIHPDELSKKWIDKMVSIGCEVLALHPVGGKYAYKSLCDMLSLLESKEFCALLDYAKQCGLEIEYEMHAARYLLPQEEFSAHPDWFRMDENKNRTHDFNFCASTKDALDFVAKNAAALAKKLYLSAHNYYFWLDDARASHCHCEKCTSLSASDQQLIIMNHIINELRKDIPDARLAYLAYFNCSAVPQKILPEDGIFLEYAPFDRDFAKGADEVSKDDKENMRGLIEYFGKNNARVLEYWYDNSLFSKWKKPPSKFVPNNSMIKKDIEFYTKLGFCDIASFACYLGNDYEKLYGEADISAFSAK